MVLACEVFCGVRAEYTIVVQFSQRWSRVGASRSVTSDVVGDGNSSFVELFSSEMSAAVSASDLFRWTRVSTFANDTEAREFEVDW